MSDALTKVRTELGRDAVILHTRTVRRGGLFGIGARSLVEITATADPHVAVLRASVNGRASEPSRDRTDQSHPDVHRDEGAVLSANARAPAQQRLDRPPSTSRSEVKSEGAAVAESDSSPPRFGSETPRPLPPPSNWPGRIEVGASSESDYRSVAPVQPHPFTLIQDAEQIATREGEPPQVAPRASNATSKVEAPPSAGTASPEDPQLEPVAAPLPVAPNDERDRHTPTSIPVASPPATGGSVPEPVRVVVNSDPALRTEVTEIRAMVRDLLRQAEQVRRSQVPAELVDYYTQLVGQDVAQELVAQLLDRVAARVQLQGPAGYWDEHGRPAGGRVVSPEWVRRELEGQVAEMVPPAAPLALSAEGRPTTVAMVGPTGVGKTTTIAKLAANMKLREGKKVGLITIDTYRIAAVEQLKTYAEILQVPLVAVTTPEEMQDAVRQMADLDLILIDTAGRSQKDEPRIAELHRFLSAVQPDQVHLVLSSTSREEAIREAIRNFSVLGAQHVIFTKLDEAVGFGVILNVLRSVNMRLSYLTNGQSVPADIEVGSAQRVAQLILGESSDVRPGLDDPSGRDDQSRPDVHRDSHQRARLLALGPALAGRGSDEGVRIPVGAPAPLGRRFSEQSNQSPVGAEAIS